MPPPASAQQLVDTKLTMSSVLKGGSHHQRLHRPLCTDGGPPDQTDKADVVVLVMPQVAKDTSIPEWLSDYATSGELIATVLLTGYVPMVPQLHHCQVHTGPWLLLLLKLSSMAGDVRGYAETISPEPAQLLLCMNAGKKIGTPLLPRTREIA